MCKYFSIGIANTLSHKLTLNQISRSSFSLPTDVTLKLSDGSIEAHKTILAAVSPVFEKMFYGEFKEGKSTTIDLPKDSCKIMGLMVDFVCYGTCKLNDVDDIFPLLEAFDRYQINKIPFYYTCSGFILSQLDISNYLTLLPKFASVMSEEGIKRAANKVMCYTKNDFIVNFDNSKDLPEEVLLQLLQMDITNHEVDVFDFLVKWYDYQTKDLGKSLQLTSQLFQCVRYSLIIPQILSSRVVARCSLVSKQLLSDAFHYIYSSCSPLGEYNSNECSQEPISPSVRKPRCSLKIQWLTNNVRLNNDNLDEYNVNFNSKSVKVDSYIMKSSLLRNGIYTFSVINIGASYTLHNNSPTLYPGALVSVAVSTQNRKYLYFYPLISDSLITVYVHDEYLFLKLIESDKVKSIFSIAETGLFTICICNNILQDYMTTIVHFVFVVIYNDITYQVIVIS